MARELKHIDIDGKPDLVRIAEEVQATREPQALCRDGEDIAVVIPAKATTKRPPPAQPVTRDDTLFRLIGIGESAIPGASPARSTSISRESTAIAGRCGVVFVRSATAFTFDHHFAQYGFTILTPDLL